MPATVVVADRAARAASLLDLATAVQGGTVGTAAPGEKAGTGATAGENINYSISVLKVATGAMAVLAPLAGLAGLAALRTVMARLGPVGLAARAEPPAKVDMAALAASGATDSSLGAAMVETAAIAALQARVDKVAPVGTLQGAGQAETEVLEVPVGRARAAVLAGGEIRLVKGVPPWPAEVGGMEVPARLLATAATAEMAATEQMGLSKLQSAG
jgi:hypothetical protein